MSVETSLGNPQTQIEYIFCVEGIGWPTNEVDLTEGFDGDVFVTNDLNGNLASVLGCTIHYGLDPGFTITDTFDPVTYRYSSGSMKVKIQDQDDWFLGNYHPRWSSGTQGVLQSALSYESTEVRIDNAAATWSNAEVIWVGGVEAILLANRTLVSGTVYKYTSCTRGYLGTVRGKQDAYPYGTGKFSWEANTAIHDYARYWGNRRVHLYAHIPAEAVGNCYLLYAGRLKDISATQQGLVWQMQCAGDRIGQGTREHASPASNVVKMASWVSATGVSPDRQGSIFDGPGTRRRGDTSHAPIGQEETTLRRMLFEPAQDKFRNKAEAYAAAYQLFPYRTEVGGTKGVITALNADENSPQAPTDSEGRFLSGTLVDIDGNIVRARYHDDDSTAGTFRVIDTETVNYKIGTGSADIFEVGSQVRYLLDNILDDRALNRFLLDGQVTRNPIDVALMFLTSTNDEYFIGDTTGGTTTVPTFAASSFTADEWIGYALFCVEGTNKYECRLINDNATNSITVTTAFTNAPTASTEYQVRNSIYDVLPLGWGLGINNKYIDIDSFEDVKFQYLADAELGRFAIGTGKTHNFDMLEFLQKNLFEPYGISIYIARGTGMLTARYVGEVNLSDGLMEDYVQVTSTEIIDIGDIEMMPRKPTGKISLEIRDVGKDDIKPKIIVDTAIGFLNENRISGYENEIVENVTGTKTREIPIVSSELDTVYGENLEEYKITALMNSVADANYLAARCASRLVREARPYPETTIQLDPSFITKVQAGALLTITDTGNFNPVDPYDAARGWANMACRVLSTSIQTSDTPKVTCRVQLMDEVSAGLITPACTVTSKGSDGGGAYFVVNLTDFVVDAVNDEDWTGLGVDDRIELRNKDGSSVEVEVIKGFGSNLATDPASASNARIYVDGAISSSITAGDYITFTAWSGSNTDNMNRFAAYADANDTLGAGNDAAFEYA